MSVQSEAWFELKRRRKAERREAARQNFGVAKKRKEAHQRRKRYQKSGLI